MHINRAINEKHSSILFYSSSITVGVLINENALCMDRSPSIRKEAG